MNTTNTSTEPPKRDRWARLRFSIIGPLLAGSSAPRTLHAELVILSAKIWRHPLSGLDVTFAASTLERWYYTARRANDPVMALKDRLRGDIGHFPSLTSIVIETLTTQYREHQGWTVQLHFDNLCAALKSHDTTIASYPTIRRYMKARGMFRQAQPKLATAGALAARDRLEQFEVRSFEVEHVCALWHLDFHHCSRKVLTRHGAWVKPMLLCVIDDRSRLVCHIQWYLDETAESLIHGMCQAFVKYNLPRALMTDNGSAMLAAETTSGLFKLCVLHQTTLPYSPYQNAKQESFWVRVESRLMPMLEGEANLTLDALNLATQAWAEQEYNLTPHSEIGVTPLAHYLAGPNIARPCPASAVLAASFRIEVKRKQRPSDGTVNLEGGRFEIPSRYRHFEHIHLQYARWDLSRIDMVEPRSGAILCSIKPLDKTANANGRRRQLPPVAVNLSPLPPAGMPALMINLLIDHAAAGIPQDDTATRQIEAFQRFHKILSHETDQNLVLIKSHFLIEAQVRKIVDERLKNPDAIIETRIDFHQAICIAQAFFPANFQPWLWGALKKLDKVRNAIAHKLEPESLNDKIEDFITSFPSDFTDFPTDTSRFEITLCSIFIAASALAETPSSHVEL